MLDYVAADENGPVKAEQKAPSARFVASRARKGKPFAETPDLKDGVVYQDERAVRGGDQGRGSRRVRAGWRDVWLG